MKKTITKIGMFCSLFMFAAAANAQTMSDTTTEFKPGGKLWGYAFGDYAYKGATDDAGRGGSNQYTKVPLNNSQFQWRRIYLGYNYNISKKFQAEFLLAAEDDFNGNLGQGTGDVLTDDKFTPYVKLANIRWKNIWRGSDLVLGQSPTPTFAQGAALKENTRNSQTSEEVWGYRSIERTVTDIRRTGSYDLGAQLQGWFDSKGCFGYDAFVANGTGAKPENDAFKWFYGDVYAKFFNKHLIIDLYQDYNRMNWNPLTTGQAETKTVSGTTTTYSAPSPVGLHRDRNMTKLFVAWQSKKLTIGVEAFQNTLMGDVQEVVSSQHAVYYATTKAMAISTFVHGAIYKNKLGFFARYDYYNPSGNLSAIYNNSAVTSYSALTSQYDPTTKEQFITYGLDYTPIKNVHIMPNIWLNTYASALPGDKYSLNAAGGTPSKGSDCVYRLTFYYIYGK